MTNPSKKTSIIIELGVLLVPLAAFPPQANKESVCVFQTNLGTMAFKFFEADAPQAVKKFQELVRDGFYNGKDFYRVVKGHVIQAEVDIRCREAAALPCLPAGRLDGGRGGGGILLRTRGFERGRRSIVFREAFRSSATQMSPAGPSHDSFLVIDFDPRPGLSFFRERRQRFRAECGECRATQKNKILSSGQGRAVTGPH